MPYTSQDVQALSSSKVSIRSEDRLAADIQGRGGELNLVCGEVAVGQAIAVDGGFSAGTSPVAYETLAGT